MKKRIVNKLCEFVVVPILICAALYGGVCLWQYSKKPLFVNRFGFLDERLGPIPAWSRWRSEIGDDGGNRFIADFQMNLFVVIQMPTDPKVLMSQADAATVTFVLLSGEEYSLTIGKDALLWIREDGAVDSCTLPKERAEELFHTIETISPSARMKLIEDQCRP